MQTNFNNKVGRAYAPNAHKNRAEVKQVQSAVDKQLANMEKRIVESIAKTTLIKRKQALPESCRYGNNCTNPTCAFSHPAKAASGTLRVPKMSASVGEYVPSSNHAVSDYLKIVFDPRSSIVADIPDSVMLAHTNFDTVTAINFIVEPDTEEGMFFLYPADQSNLIAYYYVKKSTGFNRYEFVRSVRTSQNLGESYDSGRKISSLTQVSSTTVGAGAFQLSGTLSALKIVGTLSELPELNYETLIGRTAGNIDKVANVPITTGITALSLFETFDAPYTRMDDVPPFESSIVGTTAYIHDRSQTLTYAINVPKTRYEMGDFDLEISMNVDCHTCLTLSGSWFVASGNSQPNETNSSYLLGIFVELYDPFGNRIQMEAHEGGTVGGITPYFVTMRSNALEYMPSTSGTLCTQLTDPAFHDKYGPIAAVKIKMQGREDPGTTPNQPFKPTLNYANFNFDVAKGQRSGSENSVQVICYSNASAGSTITMTNYVKYELIPNPQIRETVPAAFIRQGTIIPGMADFVKAVMSRANELDLRYVYNTSEYEKLLPSYMAIAEGKSPMIAKAGLMDIFRPLLGQIPVIGPLLANAASGKMRAKAAVSSMKLRKTVRAKAGTRTQQHFLGPLVTAHSFDGDLQTTSMVVFPTILEDVGTKLPVQGGFYAVFPGDHSRLLQEKSHVLCNGFKLHGVIDTQVNVQIKKECTILPVVYSSRGWCIANGPLVQENSFNVALHLVGVSQYEGLFPFIVTGETNGDAVLQMTTDVFRYKQEECRKVGFELVGNNHLAGAYKVENMSQVVKMKMVAMAKTHTYHHAKAKAGGGDSGADLLESFLTEQEIERMIVFALNQKGATTLSQLHANVAPSVSRVVFERIAHRFLHNNPGVHVMELPGMPNHYASNVEDLLHVVEQTRHKAWVDQETQTIQQHVPAAERLAAHGLVLLESDAAYTFEEATTSVENLCRFSLLSRFDETSGTLAQEAAQLRSQRDAWQRAMENMSTIVKNGNLRSRAATQNLDVIGAMETKSFRMRTDLKAVLPNQNREQNFQELLFHQQHVVFPDDTLLASPGQILYDSGTVCVFKSSDQTYAFCVASGAEREAVIAVEMTISNWNGENVASTISRTRLIVNGWTKYPRMSKLEGRDVFMYCIVAPDHTMIRLGGKTAVAHERRVAHLEGVVHAGCQACGKLKPTKRCTQCGERFCDADCQRRAWAKHKTHCRPRTLFREEH